MSKKNIWVRALKLGELILSELCPFPTLAFCVDRHIYGIIRFYKHISNLLAHMSPWCSRWANLIGQLFVVCLSPSFWHLLTSASILTKLHWNDPWVILSENYSRIWIFCRILVVMASKNFKNLLVRNCWTNFNIIWHKCAFGNPLQRLFMPAWFVKKQKKTWPPGTGGLFFLYTYIVNFKNLLVRIR